MISNVLFGAFIIENRYYVIDDVINVLCNNTTITEVKCNIINFWNEFLQQVSVLYKHNLVIRIKLTKQSS